MPDSPLHSVLFYQLPTHTQSQEKHLQHHVTAGSSDIERDLWMVERVLALSHFWDCRTQYPLPNPPHLHPHRDTLRALGRGGVRGRRLRRGSGMQDELRAHTAAGAGEGREERGEALEGVGTAGLARAGQGTVCAQR